MSLRVVHLKHGAVALVGVALFLGTSLPRSGFAQGGTPKAQTPSPGAAAPSPPRSGTQGTPSKPVTEDEDEADAAEEETGPDEKSPTNDPGQGKGPQGGPPAEDESSAEDEADAEMAEEEDEPSPSRPPSAGKGAVWGVVKSGLSGETLVEATVSVVNGTKKAFTDVDGRFRLELPPGVYELRVFYELHKASRIQNVKVEAGQVGRVDVTLEADKAAEEETTAVEAEFERGTAASQLMIRKNAASVSDAISAQDIARTPDRNAADSAKRIVGASVVDARYVFVRGLGERYTNSLLNGAPLPSPEPDKNAVPLDLFPSLVLSDLTIHKTFTPDMPADFAGGSVVIHTRDMPSKFQIQSTLALGANTQSTTFNRLSYKGGGLDWLGIDDGSRSLPSGIPGQTITRILPDGTLEPNLTQYGRSLNRPMTTRRSLNLPNGSANIVVGDSLKFGARKEQALGYQFAASYSRRFTRKNDEQIRTFTVNEAEPGRLIRLNDYQVETGLDQVSWSGLGTVSYAPNLNNKLTLTSLYSRSADNEARFIQGPNDEAGGQDIQDTRLRFLSRELVYGQLRGEHTFRGLNEAVLSWNGNASNATLNEPGTRETIYAVDPAFGPTFIERTLSGSHFFADQKERTLGGGVDWTQPIIRGSRPYSLKAGGLVIARHRTFQARRFRYLRTATDPIVYSQPADQLFTNDNIGTVLELEEWTRANDIYIADHNVFSGYLMGDITPVERFRIVTGARVESSRQTIDSFDPTSANAAPLRGELDKTDILPALNFIYKTTEDTNLRLSFSRTVARPQLRELAPFSFTDYLGAREIKGEPNLNRTLIWNADLRYEWFPAAGEVLAATIFGKSFANPIESIVIPTNQGAISFQNAKAATNFGVELEARKGLGLFTKALEEFSVIANLTLVYSRVELDTGPGQFQTNSVRPLAGQSPYIVNGAIDWNHEKTRTKIRVLYNIFGERIAQVGQNKLPDVFEQPRHQLDASVTQGIIQGLDLKLTIENLLDTPIRFTQGDEVVQRIRYGQNFWLLATISN